MLRPGPLSCTQHQCPRGEAVLSVGDGDKGPNQVVADCCHGDGFSGNQVKATRGGNRVALMPRIRTSHSPYPSLGINHMLTLQDVMCRACLQCFTCTDS